MASTERSEDGTFTVDLRSLDLPAETQEKIAQAIQKAILSEIASLDLAISSKIPRLDTTLRLPHPGAPKGMWIQPIRDS